MSEKIESANLREEAYCDGEPMESIRALLLGIDSKRARALQRGKKIRYTQN